MRLAWKLTLGLVVVVACMAAVVVIGRSRFAMSGGKVFSCGRLGGSWPVDFADEARLRQGYTTAARLATVNDEGVTLVATEVIAIEDDARMGIGVWAAGDDVKPEDAGAVDKIAVRFSHGPQAPERHRAGAAAARSCYRGGAG